MDCLRGLIGLTNSPKYLDQELGLSEDHKTSSLGKWAWELIGPILLGEGNMDTNQVTNDVWIDLINAYESALVQVAKDLPAFLGSRIQAKFGPYSGRIGETGTTGIVAVPGGLAGYALPTRELLGGSLFINKLGLMLNAEVSNLLISLTRYNGPMPVLPSTNLTSFLNGSYMQYAKGEVIKQWNIDVIALDSTMYKVTPMALPLDGSIYTISYQLPPGVYPMNNRLSCNCGGKDETLNKMLTTRLQSINGDHAHGLLLEMSSTCDFSGLICDLLTNNQYEASIGYMIYYRTALNVVEMLLGDKLTPAVQIRKEDLTAKRDNWEAELGKYLAWITTNWDPSFLPSSRCYMCTQPNRSYIGTLSI